MITFTHGLADHIKPPDGVLVMSWRTTRHGSLTPQSLIQRADEKLMQLWVGMNVRKVNPPIKTRPK